MSEVKNEDYAAFVGIDWADKKHDVCLRTSISSKHEARVLAHSPETIEDWANQLRVRFGGQPVAVCLEQRKGPLIYALLKYDHLHLFPVNPKTLADYRRAFSPSGAKDDPTDAELLLDLVFTHRDRLPKWLPDDPLTREIAQLCESRRNLVGARIRVTNQLTANLKGYYPQALGCFDALESTIACDFLTRWPCLADAKRARKATLADFFYKHGVRDSLLIEKRVKELKGGVALTNDSALINASTLLTRSLVGQLEPLMEAIGAYGMQIAECFAKHPDAHIFQSLPGAGPTFAPRLLAAFGSNRDRFPSAESVQEYGGIAPVTERSGKSEWVHWRYACSNFIRQTFVEWAGMSVRYSYWANAYYHYQREKGKSHNVAVRALAFKWIRIVFRCWKNRVDYDESKYLFALRKNNSPLLKYMTESN